MPTWLPNWTDVRFDHRAVEAAAEACDRAAHVVRDTSGQRQGLATVARGGATGPWILRFDTALATMGRRSEEVEGRLRATARLLREASRSAQAEQSARLDARIRWGLEAAAEEATRAAITGRAATA